jgi:hypothetical protein
MRSGYQVSQLMNVASDMSSWVPSPYHFIPRFPLSPCPQEILGSLFNGCTLCIRGETSKEVRDLLKTVDILIATPSMLST